MADDPRSPNPPYDPPKGSEGEATITTDGGAPLSYRYECAWMVLRDQDDPAAEMFYTAYLADEPGVRPLTFVFNGGPGAAAAFLHLGGLGPYRVAMNPDGTVPPAPAQVVENPQTWLRFTDLVFVDPIGTGFSRPIDSGKAADAASPPDESKKETSGGGKRSKKESTEYYALDRDLASLREFIQRFLTRHKRWDTPIFIAGESYGGFRAAKLVRSLQEMDGGVSLNGAILISPALEFALLDASDYDILPWVSTFPTMALSALHHGKSRTSHTDDESLIADAERFALQELTSFLVHGTMLEERLRSRTLKRAADYLGLPVGELLACEGRVTVERFARLLLADEQRLLGRYDTTVTVENPFPNRDGYAGPDPTLVGDARLFASGVNTLLRKHLDVETDRIYRLLSLDVNRSWKIDIERHAFDRQVGATDDLRYGLSLNPHMRVLIVHGRYDLVTPYFAAKRQISLLRGNAATRGRVSLKTYGGGHMFYTWESERNRFTDDAKSFFAEVLR